MNETLHYNKMQSQPLDIIELISSHLNLRSLVKFSMTCKRHYKRLKPNINSLKNRLFRGIPYEMDGDYLMFYSGPALFNNKSYYSEKIPELPMNGVYFLDVEKTVNFFFQKKFGKFLVKPEEDFGSEFIATTQTLKVHRSDLGCLHEKELWELCYWDDLNCDYRKAFVFDDYSPD